MDHESIDVTPQMAVENGFEKFVDFAFFALNLEFNPAIDQVFHRIQPRRTRS